MSAVSPLSCPRLRFLATVVPSRPPSRILMILKSLCYLWYSVWKESDTARHCFDAMEYIPRNTAQKDWNSDRHRKPDPAVTATSTRASRSDH